MKPRFLFGTVLWGSEFIHTFLDICLPSQCFVNNLIYFANHTESAYRIYTSPRDAATIQRSKIFSRLKSILPVEIATVNIPRFASKYGIMTECHAHLIRSVRADDRALIFVIPDLVWADGALSKVLEICNTGKRVILYDSPRIAKESFVREIGSRYGKGELMKAFGSRELVSMALRHLHPETRAMFWESENLITYWPTYLFWPVGEEGLISRQSFKTPLVVNPRNREVVLKPPLSAIDYDYVQKACPDMDEIYFVDDSDEICLVDLTSEHERVEGIVPGKYDVETIARFIKTNSNLFGRDYVKRRVRFHSLDVVEDRWRHVEQRSDEVMNSILSCMECDVCPVARVSRTRYLRPGFLLAKLRIMGVKAFLRRICRSILRPLFDFLSSRHDTEIIMLGRFASTE